MNVSAAPNKLTMPRITFDSLLADRCDESGKPEYWRPSVPKPTPYQWETYGIPGAIERVLALQLALELPVGQFVAEASRSELPVSSVTKKLLLSNIADENVHFYAFKYASQIYPISDLIAQEAECIARSWSEMLGHPIEKPALLECGVFTPALAFLQICGGQSLASIAGQIAKDEQRHVATNRGVMRKLGLDPGSPAKHLDALCHETLSWLFDGLLVPCQASNRSWLFESDFDKDFLIQESSNLVKFGFSPGLNRLLIGGSIYVPPFEKENSEQAY